MQQFVLNEELALHRVPRPMHLIIGLGMAGPTIIVHGTEEQKKKYLPGIINGTDIWCQGYSEPGSGSDLASLQTRAVRDGDDYVINGQKIWTIAGAHGEVDDRARAHRPGRAEAQGHHVLHRST